MFGLPWRARRHWHLGRLDGSDRSAVLALWEASVRTSHGFFCEADIRDYLLLLEQQWLRQVRLQGLRDRHGCLLGFSGVSGERLEMLFIDPQHWGLGVGSVLLRHALHLGVHRVDVNEQNPRALAFYQARGFAIEGRSALDGAGKPYPLLHLLRTV